MASSDTRIEYDGVGFDLAAIGTWLQDNAVLAIAVASILFIFHLFRPGGFAEKYLAYRIRGRELDAKRLDDVRRLTDIYTRRYDRDDPFLPFDDGLDER